MNLPKSVNIIEVGPRDGFQNIKNYIETNVKTHIINKLIEAGISRMEVTSFVNPKAIPQMSDASAILKNVGNKVRHCVLVPNKKGAELAMKAGAKELTVVLSASESHNQSNTRRTIEESLSELQEIKNLYGKDAHLRVDIATAFGCPFEGEVKIEAINKIVSDVNEMGIKEIVLCDTTGMANPLLVETTIKRICNTYRDIEFGVHFHNTRGVGVANILTAIENGIKNIETSIGGLGGCPFAPGASGNVATEDVVNMLADMGIKTGINLEKLIECGKYVREALDESLSSQVLIAGSTYSGGAACKIKGGKL